MNGGAHLLTHVGGRWSAGADRTKRFSRTAVVAGLLFAGLGASPVAAAAPARSAPGPVCDGGWHRVKTPNPFHDYADTNQFSAVASVSSADAWAIGSTVDFDRPPYGYRALAEHWDGHSWEVVQMPSSPTYPWTLMNGLVALASDDVWAVGEENTSPYYSIIEHWDGTAWTIQEEGTPNTYLTSVTGLGPDDIWAAGSTDYVGNGLILHWDGTSWNRTVLPYAINFRAIEELAPNDIWAVGQQPTSKYLDLTTAWHFDGTTWTKYPTPSPLKIHPEDENWLNGIDAISSNDIWAAGVARDPDWGLLDRPFMLHWDGTTWSLVQTPDPGGNSKYTDLSGVVAYATDDVWSVGGMGDQIDDTTFTVHWDGSSWSEVSASTPGAFAAATKDGRGGLWAVGNRHVDQSSAWATKAQHLCPA